MGSYRRRRDRSRVLWGGVCTVDVESGVPAVWVRRAAKRRGEYVSFAYGIGCASICATAGYGRRRREALSATRRELADAEWVVRHR